jgi:hypothetical protein
MSEHNAVMCSDANEPYAAGMAGGAGDAMGGTPCHADKRLQTLARVARPVRRKP